MILKFRRFPRKLFRAANTARLATCLIVLWKLFKHPQTPKAVKLIAVLVLAYAVSPIDLIPDFIPVLGQLDDLVVIPLGIALVRRLTPVAHWEARWREAEVTKGKLPRWGWSALAAAAVWLLLMVGLAVWVFGA